MSTRIGYGYDAHRFQEGRPLILGGVPIDYSHGLAAHSDGDAVIHALCDALLGAAGLGDIGHYFPDTDVRWKGANSRLFLQEIRDLIHSQGYSIGNIDVTIIAQAPKLAPYREAMRSILAEDLAISPGQVNIKATTTEGMGFVGRKEGIAVQAVALLIGAENR